MNRVTAGAVRKWDADIARLNEFDEMSGHYFAVLLWRTIA
jgi:hypothetical protein